MNIQYPILNFQWMQEINGRNYEYPISNIQQGISNDEGRGTDPTPGQ
jgi:hypothetical protein